MRRSLTGLDVNKSILLGATLWDWRAELASAGQGDVNELSAFGAWVTSDRFPMAWWLPRLVFAITAPSFSIEWRLGEYIAQAAPQYPDEALLVIQRLLAARPEPYQRYGLMGQVPAVVAAALDHGPLAPERRRRIC
jgi:hypothetical protein